MNTQYRQGDVFIQSVDKLPKTLKVKKDNVIAKGDSSNLNHTLVSGKVLVDRKGNMFLEVPRKTQVVHEHGKGHGHKVINLSKGFYKVIRQRETTMGDMTRIVQD